MGALYAYNDDQTTFRRNLEAVVPRLLMPWLDVDNAAVVKVDAKPIDGLLLAGAVADLYAAPATAGSFVKISSITILNTSGSTVTGVQIYLSAGATGVAETIHIDSLAAGQSRVLAPFGGWDLPASGKIRGFAGTASVVSFRAEIAEWAAQPSGLVLKVVNGVALGTSFSTIYTAPTVRQATLLSFTLCNTDTVARAPVIAQVESGDTASAEDQMFGDSLAAKATTIDDTPRILQTGDFIQGKCAAAGAVVSCRLTILEAA